MASEMSSVERGGVGARRRSWSTSSDGEYTWDPEGDVGMAEAEQIQLVLTRHRVRPILVYLLLFCVLGGMLVAIQVATAQWLSISPHKDCEEDWSESKWSACEDPCDVEEVLDKDGHPHQVGTATIKSKIIVEAKGAGIPCRKELKLSCARMRTVNLTTKKAQEGEKAEKPEVVCVRAHFRRKCTVGKVDDKKNDSPPKGFNKSYPDLSKYPAGSFFFIRDGDWETEFKLRDHVNDPDFSNDCLSE